MKNIVLPILFSVLFLKTAVGQEDAAAHFYPPGRSRGLNMTPLLTHLIPFNRASPRLAGPYQFRARNYRNGKSGFRFAIGAFADPEDGFFADAETGLHLQMGWEKRKHLAGRWAYYRGFDVFFAAGFFNLPDQNNSVEPGFGVGFPLGIEFAIAPRVTLSTETELLIGGSDLGPILQFIPPVGLFLNYYIK